mgnify:CR=1 FL=1
MLILTCNCIAAFLVAYFRSKEPQFVGSSRQADRIAPIKNILILSAAYFLYFGIVFTISYKYTHYVRKEIHFNPMMLIWISGLICAILFFPKWSFLHFTPEKAVTGDVTDHVIYLFFEMLLLSTQKVDYEYLPVPIACFVNFLIYFLLTFMRHKGFRNRSRHVNPADICVLFMIAAICEYLNSVVFHSDNNLFGVFISFAVILLIFFVTLNINISIIIHVIVNTIWILIHYFVYDFRGTPFIPADVYAAGTAFDVVDQYTLYTNKQIWELLMVSLLIITCCLYFVQISGVERFQLPIRLTGMIFVITVSLLWFNSDFINDNNLYWEMFGVGTIANTYERNGCTLGFVEVLKKSQVPKPDGYSRNRVKELAQKNAFVQSDASVIRPNIIVIMNETFADIGDLGNLNASEDYMPFYHSLNNTPGRIATGRTLVSTIGGNTAKSEFEFLSGSSLAFAPQTNPYLVNIQRNMPTLVTTLQDQGYYAVATHPAASTNWNRNKVYKYMNFDEMLFIKDYEESDRLRGRVVDSEVYGKIDHILQDKPEGTPYFIFGVTIQNHGGYNVKDLEDERLQFRLPDSEPSDLDVYLSLISVSDTALSEFITMIDRYEEPTVLVFFGDHYPMLTDESFETITDHGRFSSELELEQTKYMTPYLVYSNYDIDTSFFNQLTSLNYLGCDLLKALELNMTPYNVYTYGMQDTIPAMNAYAYVNKDEMHCNYDDVTAAESQTLKDYYILEYDSLFGNLEESAFRIDKTEYDR